jgi:hypothetical protein
VKGSFPQNGEKFQNDEVPYAAMIWSEMKKIA